MSETQLATLESLTPDDVLRQIQMVQQLMAKAMKEGEHYGVIPGTGRWNPQTKKEEGKATLLKAGAEKLCLLFRLAAQYEEEARHLSGGHLEITTRCSLTQITTGKFFGAGVGSCSTLESKYRYRNDPVLDEEGNEMPVPGNYWKSRDPLVLGGVEFRAHKKKGKWIISRRVEHEDPADYYNTVRKMSAKRAYVAATIGATAASDIFTQDLEEMGDAEETTSSAPAKPFESVFTGVLTEAMDRPATDKQGNDTGGFVYFGKVGAVSLWTKDAQLGSDFIAANGCTVEVFYVPTGKSNRLTRFSVKSVPTPVQEEEPDEIP